RPPNHPPPPRQPSLRPTPLKARPHVRPYILGWPPAGLPLPPPTTPSPGLVATDRREATDRRSAPRRDTRSRVSRRAARRRRFGRSTHRPVAKEECAGCGAAAPAPTRPPSWPARGPPPP